ncbi:hypothetical protein [Pseudomonas sp. DWP3-1-2]|uniref:hypothetical protein n=1 Tax=Pseudomonas sp. DWP3-1-2 TaxID=2804645 RepID=UPI003CE8FB25
MTSTQLGLFGGLILASMGAVLFTIIFIAHKYVETIEGHLLNCSYIKDNKRVWSSAGLLGKVMRGGIIAMVLLMPTMHAKRGLIDAQEVNDLPNRYKYFLTVPLLTACVLIVLLVALSVIEKYIG